MPSHWGRGGGPICGAIACCYRLVPQDYAHVPGMLCQCPRDVISMSLGCDAMQSDCLHHSMTVLHAELIMCVCWCRATLMCKTG